MDKLRRIAAEVGVSPNTVLRVLRGQNKEVWPSAVRRAEEIRGLAQRLGYMPNGSARAMRRGRFDAVALVLSTDRGRSYLPDDLFNAIHDALAARGMRLIVTKLPDETLTSRDLVPAILREWSCDGLLINYTDHIPRAMIDLVGRYKLPAIWINSRQPADCVYYDDFGGAMAATEHLLRLGHRNVTYLDFVGSDDPRGAHYSRIDRYEGYAQAMRLAGLTPTPAGTFAGVPVAERLEVTRALLASPSRPTALLSYDPGDRTLYAAALAGLRVPQDLSLLSFAPRPPASAGRGETFIGRGLTTMRVPAEQAGAQAVQMLLNKIADPEEKQAARVVPLELEPGDTCGPPPPART